MTILERLVNSSLLYLFYLNHGTTYGLGQLGVSKEIGFDYHNIIAYSLKLVVTMVFVGNCTIN